MCAVRQPLRGLGCSPRSFLLHVEKESRELRASNSPNSKPESRIGSGVRRMLLSDRNPFQIQHGHLSLPRDVDSGCSVRLNQFVDVSPIKISVSPCSPEQREERKISPKWNRLGSKSFLNSPLYSPLSPAQTQLGACGNNSPHYSTPERAKQCPAQNFLDASRCTAFLSPENISQSPSKNLLNTPELPEFHQAPSNATKISPESLLYTPDRSDQFLGRGSFGNVILCRYKSLKFAVKLTQCSDRNEVGEMNFLGVQHPHLIRVLHVGKMADRLFICMEYAGHCNLQQLLDSEEKIDFQRRVSFCLQVASGLRHCHSLQIVHRDVKPANVIVSPAGVCKLGDFGFSVLIDPTVEQESPISSSVIGTPAYTAPEVFRGVPPSPKADVYSFGVFLWQMYSRMTPFAGEHPHVIIYKVVSSNMRPVFPATDNILSSQYISLTRSCWDKEPSKRPLMERIIQSLQLA